MCKKREKKRQKKKSGRIAKKSVPGIVKVWKTKSKKK